MLDETLGKATESAEGALATLLVGMDGMIVAGSGDAGELPRELLVASYSDLLRRIGSINREAGIQDPVELVVTGPDVALVIRKVTAEYALLMLLSPGGSLGRARFELRKAASAIQPELTD